MSTAKDMAKKVRREVQSQAEAVREAVAQEIVAGIMLLPLYERAKWALRILRGIPTRESWRSWIMSVFRRLGIEIAYQAKKLWLKVRPAKAEPPAVDLARNTATTSAEDADAEFAWTRKDKKVVVSEGKPKGQD